MPTIGVFAAMFDDEGRILCVKRNYGPRNWTNPGGRMDEDESVVAALEREVHEETGYRVEAGELIGAYSSPFKNDVVLFIEATVLGRDAWQPNEEIEEVRFFHRAALPPLSKRQQARFEDAFDGRRGVVRVFESDEG